jgi:hypothetical protein
MRTAHRTGAMLCAYCGAGHIVTEGLVGSRVCPFPPARPCLCCCRCLLLKAHGESMDLGSAQRVFGDALDAGMQPTALLHNALLQAAAKVFDELEQARVLQV